MPLNSPLSLADFFDPLPVAKITFAPADNRTFSETGGGELIPAQRGARLWRGQVSIDIATHEELAAFEAKLSVLQEVGASFLIYDRRKPFAVNDPTGSILGASSLSVSAVGANNREISVTGFPSGFGLKSGDLMSWTYGSNPTRYALYRVVSDVVASGSTANLIEVTPRLRTGTPIGAAVSMVRPVCKAVVDQADYGMGRSVITQGGTFNWIQTLR